MKYNLSEEINSLITQTPSKPLSELFLLAQIIADESKSDEFATFLKLEIKGYEPASPIIPEYRKVTPQWEYRIGTGWYATTHSFHRRNSHLPEMELYENIPLPIIALEEVLKNQNSQTVYLPDFLLGKITRLVNKPVSSVYFSLQPKDAKNIVYQIKSAFIAFLIKLNSQFGENKNLSIMEKKNNNEEMTKNTFGNITAHNLNITTGIGNLQNTGDNNQITQGNNNNFGEITKENVFDKLREMLPQLKAEVQDIPDEDDRERLGREVTVLETQLEQEQPKPTKISKTLEVIAPILESIPGGVAGNSVYDMLKEGIFASIKVLQSMF